MYHLKVILDINVDHMFERNYCRKLAWHKASTELINQYSSDLEYKLSMLQYDEEVLLCKNVMCKNMITKNVYLPPVLKQP